MRRFRVEVPLLHKKVNKCFVVAMAFRLSAESDLCQCAAVVTGCMHSHTNQTLNGVKRNLRVPSPNRDAL